MTLPPRPPPQGKKAKLYNSRAIRTEIIEPSFRNGSLSVSEFINARAFEIKSFEQSQLKTKAASSTRVFQSLPRTLRRRTASHNVKRVPKRLRSKALREMQNTVNGTPGKKQHLRGRELHRLKMQKRLLRVASRIKVLRGVPRAPESTVKEKMKSLNKQLTELKSKKASSLNNSVAAFDRCSVNSLQPKPTGNIKYGNRQRHFTWMPTHVWHAKRYHMTKRWGFQIAFSPNQKCFRATSRAAKEGTIAFESSFNCELVAECQNSGNITKFLNNFTRYCETVPGWLLQGKKVYTGWLYLDDSKFAPGIVLVDAVESKVMVRVHPSVYEQFFDAVVKSVDSLYSVVDCRFAVGSIELRGPTALSSLSRILHVDADKEVTKNWRAYSQSRDPRLVPSGTKFSFFVSDPRFWKQAVKAPHVDEQLNEVVLKHAPATDTSAVTALLSSSARTKSYENMFSIKQLGQEFARRDPLSSHIHAANKFPVIVYKSSQESWCIMMPWFWTQPMWSKLITVNGVKTAGIRQMHQINYERNIPTYPQDYPFLSEGYKEYLLTAAAAKLARSKLPLSKQKPIKSTEGPLSCEADWYFLWKWRFGKQFVKEKDCMKSSSFGNFDEQLNRELTTPDDLAAVITSTREKDQGRVPIIAYDKKESDHSKFANGALTLDVSNFLPLPVVQASLTLSEKGSIRDNARIYERVPHPTLDNLIGFVTSGAFNFSTGYPTGIGLISADRQTQGDVLVRNVGCTTFHNGKLTVRK